MLIVDYLKEAIKMFYKVLSNDKKRHKKSQFLKIETSQFDLVSKILKQLHFIFLSNVEQKDLMR